MPSPQPTHAGAVVFRDRPAGREFLLVTATGNASEWVLPKGHIEPGETAEAAALREVSEEAGVAAELVAALGQIEFPRSAELIRVEFFVARATGTSPKPKETRDIDWLPIERALGKVTHAESREMLGRAARQLGEGST